MHLPHEIIENPDAVAVRSKLIGNVRADEAAAAGYQDTPDHALPKKWILPLPPWQFLAANNAISCETFPAASSAAEDAAIRRSARVPAEGTGGPAQRCRQNRTICERSFRMTAESKSTTDRDEIRRWAEERGGRPATVGATAGGDDEAGLLRIRFPGVGDDEALEDISWDAFFDKFEEKRLAFLYQEETKGGGTSRFFKFVSRN
jgi:hypothetical protein